MPSGRPVEHKPSIAADERKLLPARTERPKKSFYSYHRRHVLYPSGAYRTYLPRIGHVKDPDFKERYAQEPESFEAHSMADATIHDLIVQRAGGLVRAGKLRIVPATYQWQTVNTKKGPRKHVQKWSTHRDVRDLWEILTTTKSKGPIKRAYLQVMRQLAYLHSAANVTHGDMDKIGSSNVLFWDKKNAHLHDFGNGQDLRKFMGEGGNPKIVKALMMMDVRGVLPQFLGRLSREDFHEGVRSYSNILKKSKDRAYFEDIGLFSALEPKKPAIS